MKNIFTSLAVAFVALFALSCEKIPVEDGKLATPTFTCKVEANTIIVTWDAVAGAAYYEVTLNNNEPERTDKTIYRFSDLSYDKEYTVKLQAVAADAAKSSEVAEKRVTIGERVVPVYREWYPQNNASATAISDNGRWVVGGFDHQGMIIDLNTDEVVMAENFEISDVSDEGVGVGAYYGDSMDGEAAIWNNGVVSKIDLSELTTSNMSSLMSITPDGEYMVGWWWEYDANSYYYMTYGQCVPFCYDAIKDRVTVPTMGTIPYEVVALSLCGVAPDRSIIGYLQATGPSTVVLWEDEYSEFTTLKYEYDAEYNPVLSFGDGQSRFSPSGNYVCGIAKTFEFGEAQQPAVYDREADELIVMTGKGSATCVTNDGIAFLNDVPYYLGTTSYVVDLKGDIGEQTPLYDWLLDVHGIDLYNYIQEGIITIGASADGRKLLGITNTMSGWMCYVIDLDGEPMPEL